MGQIRQQTIKGTIYSYIGVILGFMISGLFLPNILTPGENGLLKLLISYSSLFAQFATLGFNSATTRLFTYFRDHQKNHHGFLFLNLLVMTAGFILAMFAFYLLRDYIIGKSEDTSALFVNYINFLIPLIFFTLLFQMLDTYYKVLFKTVIGTFLKEFIQRIFVLASIALFFFGTITFEEFVIAYVISNSLPGFILFFTLIFTKEFNLRPELSFLNKSLVKQLGSISFYGILFGFTGILVLNIDSIMISTMIGISATGIYAITYFFGTLIIVPARSLRKISGTILADAWRDQNMKVVEDLYKKSSINQFVFGALLFIGIWANIHNVFEILPEEYQAGKWVIFFIGMMNLVEMVSGVSNTLLATSKYYKYTAYLNILMVGFIVGSNYIFIQLFGLVGAAVASLTSIALISLIRYVFIYKRFHMHPFTRSHLLVILISLGTYFLSLLLPPFKNFILDIAVRSISMLLVFSILVYFSKVSEDINKYALEGIDYFKQRNK